MEVGWSAPAANNIAVSQGDERRRGCKGGSTAFVTRSHNSLVVAGERGRLVNVDLAVRSGKRVSSGWLLGSHRGSALDLLVGTWSSGPLLFFVFWRRMVGIAISAIRMGIVVGHRDPERDRGILLVVTSTTALIPGHRRGSRT